MATGENFTIDQFTGADVNEAKCWVSKFELYCKFKKFNDATKLAVFPLRLADTCFDWYQTLNDDIKNDYELLKAAFLKRYGPDVRTSFERKKMLWKKQQAPSQSVRQWVEEVQKHARGLDVTQKDLMDVITGGIYQKTVRDAIIQQKAETIEELIEAATLVESSTGQTQGEARLLSVIDTLTAKLDGLTAEVQSMAAANVSVNPVATKPISTQKFSQYARTQDNTFNKDVTTRYGHSGARNSYSIRLCYRCGERTHSSSVCWAKELVCRNCGKVGHIRRACRSAQGQGQFQRE